MRYLLRHLRHRKLVHWSIAYLASAWLLLQVLALLAEPFGWPSMVVRVATMLLAGGFLAALVLAWYHGEKGAQKVSGVELLMLATVVVIAGAAAAFVSRDHRTPTADATVRKSYGAEQASIAVLPFSDLSASGDQKHFTDGLTEELLNVLAQLPELRVVARTSSFAFRGKPVPIDSIARALHVTHVLEGSVRKEDNHIRITAQLINAADGYHVWSANYDREVGSIFEVQDEIARSIVSALEMRLDDGRTTTLAKKETKDAEAHSLVLTSAELVRQPIRRSLERAVSLLQQAIARDSTYARAYARLAVVYLAQNYFGYGRHDTLTAKARAAAARAQALDPQLADAEIALGMLAADVDWDFRAAEAHFSKAAILNPGRAYAHIKRAWLLAQLGHVEQAVKAAQRAAELNPIDEATHSSLATMYYYNHQNERALQTYRVALELGEDPTTLSNRALAYTMLGNYAAGIASAERALQLMPGEEFILATLAYVHARAGDVAAANRYTRLLERNPNYGLLALAYAGIGDRERTLKMLEKGVAERDPAVVHNLGAEPIFDEYRDEPRFRALLRHLRLK